MTSPVLPDVPPASSPPVPPGFGNVPLFPLQQRDIHQETVPTHHIL